MEQAAQTTIARWEREWDLQKAENNWRVRSAVWIRATSAFISHSPTMHAASPEFWRRRLKSRKTKRMSERNAQEFVVAVVWRPYRSQCALIKRFFILHFTPLSALFSCIMCKSSAVIVFACMKEAELAPWYSHSSPLMFFSSFWLSHSSSSSVVFCLVSIRSWKLFWRLQSSHELHYSLRIKILYANLLVSAVRFLLCVFNQQYKFIHGSDAPRRVPQRQQTATT